MVQGRQYQFVNARENNRYDAAESRLDENEYAASGAARLNALRQQRLMSLPTVTELRQMEAAVQTEVQQDANDVQTVASASHTVANMEAGTAAVGSAAAGASVPPGPLVNANAASRARVCCIGIVSGVLGIVIGMGGLAGILKLAGYLDTAQQMAAGQTPQSQPTADELAAWAKLPGTQVLEQLRENATRSGAEWSVGTWCYVTSFLNTLLGNLDAADLTTYSRLFVTDTQLKADYADWKANGKFDPIYIFDKSAAYPDPKADPNHNQHALWVRVEYMSRITSMVIATDGP
jgi:hypothetical protein